MSIITALSASGREGRPATQDEITGYLRADGADLRDVETGAAVRLVGANWHGAEGGARVPNGLSERNYMEMMDQMVDAGLNSIRLPISPAVLWDRPITGDIDFSRNPSLRGLTAIEVIDEIVEYAGRIGLRIVVDMHRRDPGVGKQEDGLWFDEDYSLGDLTRDWQRIAERYAGDPTVVGFDLFNEPSGRGADRAHWGEPDRPAASDWVAAAEHLGDAIGRVNPDALIFVEGVHIYDDRWYWVGGNLKGARDRPVELELDDRLVYSPHDYPASVQNVPWLQGAGHHQMQRLFEEHWGYLHERGLAPVVIGETGARMHSPQDTVYMDALFDYLEERAADSPGGNGGVGLWWWSWNPNSGDTGGLLRDDWRTLIPQKLDYIERVEGPILTTTEAAVASVAGDVLAFELEMTRNVHAERVYHYSIVSGSAKAGVDFVGEKGVVVFGPGETRATIETPILPDAAVEGNETAVLRLTFTNGKPVTTIVGTIEDLPPWGANGGASGGSDGGSNGGGLGDGRPNGGTGGEAPPTAPPTAPPSPPSSDPSPAWPSDPDAVGRLGLGAHRLDVAVVGDAARGFEVDAVLTRHDGRAVGPWDLRVDPEIKGLLHIGDPEGGLGLDRRANDAVRISSNGGGSEDRRAEIGFDVLVLDGSSGGALGIDWEARGHLGGSGTALATGRGSDSGGALDVGFDVVQTWRDGTFHAKVELTNTGDQALKAWVVELDADGFSFGRSDVSRGVHSWDLRDGGVAVASPSWNDDLGRGESFTFGITGEREPGAGAPLDAGALLSQLDFVLV